MADAAGNDKLEILCLRRDLATVDSFETALRARVEELAGFRHQSFGRVRTVERLNDPARTLVLVSEVTAGTRLAELLALAARHGLALDGSAEWCLIKQIVAAVCTLHKQGAAHGALALERIVIRPDATVAVVEYVLGPALATLPLTPAQLWADLRIASRAGAPLDQRADIRQLGLVALSIILGRPLGPDEYPARIAALVETAWAQSEATHTVPVPAALRAWLVRALGLDASNSFNSAIDANAELDKAIVESGYLLSPSDVEAFLALCLELPADGGAADARTAAAAAAPREARPGPRPVPSPAGKHAKAAARAGTSTASRPEEPTPATADVIPIETRMDSTRDEPELSFPSLEPPSSKLRSWRGAAAAAVVLLVVSGVGWAAANRYFDDRTAVRANAVAAPVEPPPAVAATPEPSLLAKSTPIAPLGPPPGALDIRTNPAGVTVTIAGQRRGVTPLTVTDLPPGRHTVLLEGPSGSVTRTVMIDTGVTQQLTADLPVPEAAPATGFVTVTAPGPIDVLENGRLVGSSQGGRITLAAGAHQLELVNQTLGYRITRTVQVTSGANTPINLEFPKGTLALNAIPWAEVWVDGERVGETPIGNLPVNIGTHEVLFRNPDLGEQRMTATVTLTAPTRLSVDLRKR